MRGVVMDQELGKKEGRRDGGRWRGGEGRREGPRASPPAAKKSSKDALHAPLDDMIPRPPPLPDGDENRQEEMARRRWERARRRHIGLPAFVNARIPKHAVGAVRLNTHIFLNTSPWKK